MSETKYISKRMYNKMVKANKMAEEYRKLTEEIMDYLESFGFDEETLERTLKSEIVADTIFYGSGNLKEVEAMLEVLNLKVRR